MPAPASTATTPGRRIGDDRLPLGRDRHDLLAVAQLFRPQPHPPDRSARLGRRHDAAGGLLQRPPGSRRDPAISRRDREELENSFLRSIQVGGNYTMHKKSLVPDEAFVRLPGGATSVALPAQYRLDSTNLGYLGLGPVLSYSRSR
ncbi:hypothetical protein AB5I41_02585 [Sphingomonas sp. MMS24-JH45]